MKNNNVHDIKALLTELDALLDDIDIGESHHDYIDLPGPEIPDYLRGVDAVDKHGRCLLFDGSISTLEDQSLVSLQTMKKTLEVDRLMNLIEQWDGTDPSVRDWVNTLQTLLDTGESVWDYLDIPDHIYTQIAMLLGEDSE